MMRNAPGRKHDGIGQSLWEDVVFHVRFWRCRRRPMVWRKPNDEDRTTHGPGSLAEHLGDDLVAASEVDGRRWVAVERWWCGWPDPPRFAVLAFNTDGSVWLASDFNHWPAAWTIKAGDTT